MDKRSKKRITKPLNVQIPPIAIDKANEMEKGQSEEEKITVEFSSNQSNGKAKNNNRRHRRSKSGGVLPTKTTAVHWDDGPMQREKHLANGKNGESGKTNTTNGQMDNELKRRRKNGRAHRRAKSHGAIRPICHPTEMGAMERTDKWTMGTDGRRGQNAEKSPVLSPPIKAQKNKITVAKRRYSVFRHDSLMWEEMPQFTESDRRLRKSVPSSPQTILVLAGLFVCGLILLISGIIVLITNWQSAGSIQNGWYYHVAGCTMLFLGFAGLGICAILQRKNITKLAEDMSRDLFNVAANAAASEEKRASEERALAGGSKKLKRMLAQVPSTMI